MSADPQSIAALLAGIAQELHARYPWLRAEPWRSKRFEYEDDDGARLCFTGTGGFMIRRAGRDTLPTDSEADALIAAAQVNDVVRTVAAWDTNRPEVKIAAAKTRIAAVLDGLIAGRDRADRRDE